MVGKILIVHSTKEITNMVIKGKIKNEQKRKTLGE